MTTSVQSVVDEILSLPADTRIGLVDQILASLNLPIRPEIDRLWAEEAEKRIAQMENGEVKPVPGEEVFDRIRRKFSR